MYMSQFRGMFLPSPPTQKKEKRDYIINTCCTLDLPNTEAMSCQ